MTTKKKFLKCLTPVGTAAYAWIARPDEGHEFSDGKYKTTLVMDANDAAVEAGIAKLQAAVVEAAIAEWGKEPKVYRSPVKNGDDIADEKEGKEDLRGKYVLTAKSKFQPGMVDAKRQELPADVFVNSGDIIRLSGVLIPYTAGGMKGIAIQLRNVQLLEQRASTGGGDEFDDVAGYDAPLTASVDANSAPSAETYDDNEDF
tara:strand:- start:1657 stop:2262 length:606 start_codon:yes stop_codon:yes gene_type:complete